MRKNNRTIVIALLSAFAIYGVKAQSLKQQGTSVEDIVPQGWNHEEATGDLNKDGIADLAVMAKPNFKEKIVTRDDGYEYNFNQPVFAIYFGTADGMLKQWKQYGELLPADEDEICSNSFLFEVTSRNVLNITVQPECSAGSYFTNITRYSFRFQNGEFYLIGKEDESVQRNTGHVEVVSENYLTWKRQVKKFNFSEDTPPTEKWTRLQKKPLEKLGARHLGN